MTLANLVVFLAIPAPFFLMQLGALDKPLSKKLLWFIPSSALLLGIAVVTSDDFPLTRALVVLLAINALIIGAHAIFHAGKKDKT